MLRVCWLFTRPRSKSFLLRHDSCLMLHAPCMLHAAAALDSFGFYKEGVYQDAKCSNQDLDHAVVLFGYGTSDQGVDYWLVKK